MPDHAVVSRSRGGSLASSSCRRNVAICFCRSGLCRLSVGNCDWPLGACLAIDAGFCLAASWFGRSCALPLLASGHPVDPVSPDISRGCVRGISGAVQRRRALSVAPAIPNCYTLQSCGCTPYRSVRSQRSFRRPNASSCCRGASFPRSPQVCGKCAPRQIRKTVVRLVRAYLPNVPSQEGNHRSRGRTWV